MPYFSTDFHQTASNAKGRPDRMVKGMVTYPGNSGNRFATLFNDSPAVAQVSTITIDTASDDTDYTVTINGVAITVNSGSSATTTTIATAMKAAIDAEAQVRGVLAPTSSAAVVTLTSTVKGLAFTITDSDANLTTATSTANDEADTVAFALGLVSTGFITGEAHQQGRLLSSSGLTAQVDKWDLVYEASKTVYMTITMEETEYSVSVAMDTNAATTLVNLAAEINALVPANTVLAAAASATLTLTAEVAGKGFDVEGSVGPDVSAATFQRDATDSGYVARSISTDINESFAGVSIFSENETVLTVEGTEALYRGHLGVSTLQAGFIAVESSDSPSLGDRVYLDLTDNKFYTGSNSGARLLLPRDVAAWERSAPSGTDLAILRVASRQA